jgi:kumamolisin
MPVPEGFVPLKGSESGQARDARIVRSADPAEGLSVTINVRRRPDGPPLPDLDYWAATPLGERTFVGREEFAELYGASPEDLETIAAFARHHGLTVTEANAARRTVLVSGTVAQMNDAFGVTLAYFETPSETYRGISSSIHIPKALAPLVESVLGLDNRRIAAHNASVSGLDAVGQLGGAGPAGASPLTPVQVAGLYNFPTTTAKGQTIGIIELGGGYALSDVQAFFNGLRLTSPLLTNIGVDGATNAPAGSVTNVTVEDPDIEVVLDIDVSGAIAQDAAIAVYFAPNTTQGFVDAIKTAAHDTTNHPSILSISWSGSEDNWTSSERKSMRNALQDAAAFGVTVFLDAGDWGSDCQVGDGRAHVMYPTSEQGVVGCGGTFIANVSGPSFAQGTWNDGAGATGGGVSDTVRLPSWQDGVGVPKSANDHRTIGRGVPDIAGNASPFSGYTLTLYGTQTTNLTITSGRFAGNGLGTIGGTSAVAPLYAGLLAVIEAQIGAPLGFINPLLYSLAAGPVFRGIPRHRRGPFTDVNDRVNNQWSGEAKPAPFYTCGPGWDACTGWGSINGDQLLHAIEEIIAQEERAALPTECANLIPGLEQILGSRAPEFTNAEFAQARALIESCASDGYLTPAQVSEAKGLLADIESRQHSRRHPRTPH